jgi:formylglycine-generating enzyme required for sulfatase activity
MGSPHYEKGRREDEKLHEVCVSEIWVAAYEVTNSQYRMFKPHHRSYWISGYDLNGENQPAYVNLVEAREYAEWLTKKNGGTRFRLPTEAEWEYACRGGTKTARYWGDNPDLACKYGSVFGAKDKSKLGFEWGAHSCDDSYHVTAPVGSFLPNEWGLFDMLGNVFEWTEDAYSDYSRHSKNNPLNLSGDKGVIRGGAWNYHPNDVRCAYRFKVPISRGAGFRLVRVE